MEHEEIAFSVDVATADDGCVVVAPKGELDMATQGSCARPSSARRRRTGP